MPLDAKRTRHRLRRLQLKSVSLAIVDAQRKDAKPLGPRDRRGRRRIEPAGKQHDGRPACRRIVLFVL
jgi:hypothetical protein